MKSTMRPSGISRHTALYERGIEKNDVYRIKEFGAFSASGKAEGYVMLPECAFAQLEDFVLSHNGEAHDFMGLSARRGLGKIITVKNYVGAIALPCGVTVEILPKIYHTDGYDESHSKRLLLDMLRTLRKAPYKAMGASGMDIARMSIIELFIRMFLDGVTLIAKRGVKCGYETIEENSPFFCGKLLVNQQLKTNYLHKERSYANRDLFSANRPENRILKTTLQYIYGRSSSTKNRNDIKRLLTLFDGADFSTDCEADFAKCAHERRSKDYAAALVWSQVFLQGASFSPFSGRRRAFALLFPMETLFESYVAAMLKKSLAGRGFHVTMQDRSYHLFDEPKRRFLIRPDIVVEREADGKIFVLDTKWKLLDRRKTNYGISQADMYQMFAYHKKYSAERVTLLYPQTESLTHEKQIIFKSQDGVTVDIRFIDLLDMNGSMNDMARILCDGIEQ